MSLPPNPYSPPGSAVADVHEPEPGTGFSVPGVKVDAGRGAGWIGEGWALFRAAPLYWIVTTLLLLCMQFALSLVPVVGSLVNALISPVYMLGILAFARGIAAGEEADIGRLFTGFREKLGPLLTVGALYLLMIVALVVVFIGLAFALVGNLASLDPEAFAADMAAGNTGPLLMVLIAFLVAAGLGVLVAAAYWFAPGLVYYTELGAWAAMQESFRACMRNWLPFLIYGILAMLVSLGGFLLIFIGFFVLSMPILMASYYSSFNDIFGREG